MTTTQPIRWHKAPNRLNDPRFIALGTLAQAALRNLDELIATGGRVIGNRTRICTMLGIEPKNARHVIEPLRDCGLVLVDEVGDQMEFRLPPDVFQTVSRQRADSEQTVARRNKETANDAGLPDRSLIENKSKKEKENRESKTPTKKRLTLQGLSPEFQSFWTQYPNATGLRETWEQWQEIATDPEAVAAIMAGLALWQTSKRWSEGFVKAPFRWLRDGMWSEKPEQAQQAAKPTTTQVHPSQLWHRRKAGELNITDAAILAACHEFRKTLRPNHIDATLDRLQAHLEAAVNHAAAV